MREVARRADVGERTLYDAFPTKAALFLHVVDVGTVGDEGEAPVADRPAFHHVVEADDPRVVIERFAGHAADLLERAGPLIMVAVESAGADDAMRGFAEAGAAATAANVATVVQRLAELDRSIDVATAVATMLALASPHVHQIARGPGGLSAVAYRTWLRSTLVRALTGS